MEQAARYSLTRQGLQFLPIHRSLIYRLPSTIFMFRQEHLHWATGLLLFRSEQITRTVCAGLKQEMLTIQSSALLPMQMESGRAEQTQLRIHAEALQR